MEIPEKNPIDYECMLNLSLDLVCIAGIDGYFKYLNPAWEKILGYTRDELLSRPFLDFIHPEDHAKNDEEVAKLAADQQAIYFENRYIHKDGSIRHISWIAQPFADEKKMYCIGKDITERKWVEEAVRESEEMFRIAFEQAPIGMCLVNPDGRFLNVNGVICHIFGYSESELLSKTFRDITHPDDLDTSNEWVRKLLAGETTILDLEKRFLHKEGHVVCGTVRAFLLRNIDGSPRFFVTHVQDITERKQAEEALRVSHHFLEIANRHMEIIPLLNEFVVEVQNFTGCAAVGLRMLDGEGNIPYEAYVGFSRPFYESESPLSINSDQCMCINVIKGVADTKHSFYTKGGSFYMNGTTRFLATVSEEEKGQTRNVCNQVGYESVTLVPIRVDNRILGLIHVADPRENMAPLEVVEVLEGTAMQLGSAIQRVRAEEEIKKSRDELEMKVRERTTQLERSNLDLQTFAFIAAHDLREPLRKVITFGGLLKENHNESLGKEGQDHLRRMVSSTERMRSLLDSLLDYSRVTTRTEPFTKVNLTTIVHEVLSGLEVTFRETREKVEVEDLPEVTADPIQMRQLFQNLIGNALKFRRAGVKAIVRVRSTATIESETLQIVVEDNGIGFDEGHLDKIFEPFQRLHGRGSPYEGTGMGLTICRRIVDRHGGSITVRSKPGEGSTFMVNLPKKQ